MINFYEPDVRPCDIDEVVKSLRSGWITRGDTCKALEREIKEKYDVKGVFVTDSNTACLELVLRYLGIKDGDEVITTPYTYSATADVIRNVGAKIVFCDLADDSYEMNYDALPALINEKTKAIIAVDIGGVPCNYQKIYEVVDEAKSKFSPSNSEQENIGRICVISDSAHSINCDGCGKNADFTAFSFHAVKNVTCGEGGALLWNVDDSNLYRKVSLLADHGQTEKHDIYKYDIECFGQNHIMTDFTASLALSQFMRVDEITNKRMEQSLLYSKLIEDCGVHYSDSSSCHLMMVRLPLGCDRDNVARCMQDSGICVNVHYIPLPMFTAYKNIGFSISEFPKAYKEFTREITLPLYNKLTDNDIILICEKFNKAVRSSRYERSLF